MRKRNTPLLLAILVPFGWSTFLHGYEAECTFDSLQRSVRIQYGMPSSYLPCEVIYKKDEENQDKSLWRASNDLSYCVDKAQGFVGELTKMGWKCEQTKSVIETNIDAVTE
ncbi:MAG: hypothetical protein CMQ36_06935 [Gammaproteobacteria bacterium]|nr:hypothetical protein [Gammaproteobacteria bacterium]HAO55513.1 hypothetical protein [Gammaproteobacteria bacterium]